MESKLTLSIDSEVIAGAKKLAKLKGASLSDIVEDILLELIKFNSITLRQPTQKEQSKSEFKGALRELRGAIKLPKNFDIKEFKSAYLIDKYQ